MGTGDDNTVIQRMARVAREGYQARAMSPAKALRLALAKAADRSIGLALLVTAVEQRQLLVADLPPALGEGGLLLLLDGPDGRRGALRLDLPFLAALIEMQTMGRVTGKPAEPRTLTRTDAAIAAPLIDAALAEFGALLTEEGGDHWGAGYAFGAMAEDARNLGLALTEAEYHHFRLMVEIGEAAQPGALSLFLPVCAAPAQPETPGTPGAPQPLTLEHSALDAPVCLQAVLTRLTLPLDRVGTLKPGDVLPFSSERPLGLRLEVGHKHKVADARLGQINGLRAARLLVASDTPPPDPGPAAAAAPRKPQAGGAGGKTPKPARDVVPVPEVVDHGGPAG